MEIIVAVALGLWFVGTVIVQLQSPLSDRLGKWDLAFVLPGWSFFAPIPGRSDVFLMCRDRRTDGSTTGWQDVTPWEARRWFNILWNPGRRDRKRVLDLLATVVTLAATVKDELVIQTSLPYLLLLNYVSSLPRPSNHTATQFLVADRDHGFGHQGQPKVLFSSASHQLEGNAS